MFLYIIKFENKEIFVLEISSDEEMILLFEVGPTTFFCMNLLVMFKLGYTLNISFLKHLEVPLSFCGGVGWWWETPIIIITLHSVELT